MLSRVILDQRKIALTIERLCYQIVEKHKDFSSTVIIGVQPRGIFLADRVHERLTNITGITNIPYGKLDITFYRDDFRTSSKPHMPEATILEFSLEKKKVVLIDDVLYTGRTIRSAMDAMMDYGRPDEVELLVLIDRRLQRHVPIQANYIGKVIDSIISERVKVNWEENEGEDSVWIQPSIK